MLTNVCQRLPGRLDSSCDFYIGWKCAPGTLLYGAPLLLEHVRGGGTSDALWAMEFFCFFFPLFLFEMEKKERKKKTPTTEGTPADDLLSAWYGVTWTACVYTHVGYVAPATTTPQYWPTAALFFLSTKKVT